MKQLSSIFGRGLLVAALTLTPVYQGSAIAGEGPAAASNGKGQSNAAGHSAAATGMRGGMRGGGNGGDSGSSGGNGNGGNGDGGGGDGDDGTSDVY